MLKKSNKKELVFSRWNYINFIGLKVKSRSTRDVISDVAVQESGLNVRIKLVVYESNRS